MTDQTQQVRPLRVQTLYGALEGSVHISPRLRTLDDLNVVAKNLVTLHSARSVDGSWSFGEGLIAVNKAWILFVSEVAERTVQSAEHGGRFTRSSLRLKIGPFEVEGQVHVPAGGILLKRLDQSNHPFLALTNVLISGPAAEYTVPFLAINRNHVVAAHEILGQPAGAETVGA